MPLPEAFWEQLPEKSDVELYEVLLQKDDYLPEALAAVEEEIYRRKLSPESLREIAAAATRKQMLAAQAEIQEHQKRQISRLAFHVILWLVLPLGLVLKWLFSVLMPP